MIALERILLPTDFSDYSRQAIQYACELAKQFDATIHVLHIVEPITLAMPSPGSALPQELLADAEQSAKEQSDQWISGRVRDMYALLGEYDLVFIVDFPNMTDAMRASVVLGHSSGITFSTSAAIPVEEFDQIVGETD